MDNIILMSDSYKYSHIWQYPEEVTYMHSYFESRGGEKGSYLLSETKFVGLQYYLKKYFTVPITQEMINEAEEVLQEHGLPFNREGWMKVVTKHNGYLPLKIRAVKEGTIIPRKNVLMTIESTDEELFWLVGWAETLLMKVWYPTTVATLSYNIYLLIKKSMEKTSDNLDKLPFMLHDFGYRGVSSEESALIGGVAHLTNFAGTDNLAAIVGAKKYYNTQMGGYSIPASEHSTITSWGKGQEKEAYQNMINVFGDKYPLYACVSDSWNFEQALDIWGELQEDVKKGGNLVIRPDSGNAKTNILLALNKLEESFGYTINSKGYKILNNVALLQGDGVNFDEIYDILNMMAEHGYSADNIAFGIGGALLQGNKDSSINRDTHKFAIKCSAIVREGKIQDVYKDPLTDFGKKSKKGRLDLIMENNQYKTIKLDESYKINEYHPNSVLEVYYENGKIFSDYTLTDLKNK